MSRSSSRLRALTPLFEARGITHVDAFISGLPTPSLPAAVSDPMLASVNRYLVEGGVFSNITEVPFWYWKFYRRFFKDVSFELVVRNMPPRGRVSLSGVQVGVGARLRAWGQAQGLQSLGLSGR